MKTLQNLALSAGFIASLVGTAYGAPECDEISVTYKEGQSKVTLTDKGCDGDVDTGLIEGVNGELYGLRRSPTNPDVFEYFEKGQDESQPFFVREVPAETYQAAFDAALGR